MNKYYFVLRDIKTGDIITKTPCKTIIEARKCLNYNLYFTEGLRHYTQEMIDHFKGTASDKAREEDEFINDCDRFFKGDGYYDADWHLIKLDSDKAVRRLRIGDLEYLILTAEEFKQLEAKKKEKAA